MNTYKFDCGCEFPIVNEKIKEIDGLPGIRIDYNNINHRCPTTWELFTKGFTKGVFQLETSLGQTWAKKLQPVTIEELSALTAILRPGMSKSIVDGKSMTQHFVDRKHGFEDFTYFHDLAEPILNETYGTMTYQEQVLSIVKIFAGFTLQQADTLRKAMGKKKADIMAQCREMFIEGCKKVGILSDEEAIAVFDIIEKSNRYNFNKSHAVSYGVTAYMCAYVKAHFPLHFYAAWLSFANGKQKPRVEIAELIQEAKSLQIQVENPNISYKNENFVIDQGKIRYGLCSVKFCGKGEINKFIDNLHKTETILNKKYSDFTWTELLFFVLYFTRKDVANNLIHSGALSQYGLTRNNMLFQLNKVKDINEKEHTWILDNKHITTLYDTIEYMFINRKFVPKRKDKIGNLLISIKNPSLNLEDSTDVIAKCEEDVLGISLSCSRLDSKNTGFVTCTCAEFSKGDKTQNVIVAMQLSRVTEWSPKDSDKKICFLTGYDKTGKIDVMVPSKEYDQYSFLLFNGNTIAVHGSINKKSNLSAKVITQL